MAQPLSWLTLFYKQDPGRSHWPGGIHELRSVVTTDSADFSRQWKYPTKTQHGGVGEGLLVVEGGVL